ncbi:hypothetical protein JCM3765_004589 [Sporobolomyces pararoseus]
MSTANSSLAYFPPPIIGSRFHNSLPPELLRHVIVYAATPSDSAWWQSRSMILASLCLVSRRFKSIAQPLLYAKISLDTRSRFAKLLRTTPSETFAAVRSLYSAIRWHDELDLENLYTLAKFAPRIQSVTVHRSTWSLKPFVGSYNLITLSLYEVDLSVASSFSFPHVKYLSLSSCYMGRGRVAGGEGVRLDVPSVRHFAFHPRQVVFDSEGSLMVSLTTPILSSVTTWLSLVDKLPRWITDNQERICYDGQIDQVLEYTRHCHRIQHLRLISNSIYPISTLSEHSFETLSGLLEEWTLVIRGADRLVTLNLDAQFDPENVWWQDSNHLGYPRYSRAISNLLNLCSSRQIRVTWDTPLFTSEFWEIVSPSFIQISEDASRKDVADGNAS